jgi:predicted HicB family RNase H-like nuclease
MSDEWPDQPPPLPSDETHKNYRRERFTIYIDPNLARAFRIYAAARRKSLSDVIAEALSRLLGQ